MQRRRLVLASAAMALGGAARAQSLPAAPSSPEPFARLQGGVPHHMTPEQEAQRVTDSPAPAARSGHGLVVYRERLYAMGGEGGFLVGGVPRQAKVFGQMESYDPRSDQWQRHAPMLTPRHAVGAAVIGDWIYVAGGGAVLGGSVQSAVHEAFTLA